MSRTCEQFTLTGTEENLGELRMNGDEASESGPSTELLALQTLQPAPPPPLKTLSLRPPRSCQSARSIPKIKPKLAGQHNYTQWILSIEQILSLYDSGKDTIWDIVTGALKNPQAGSASKAKKSTDAGKEAIQWQRDNDFAILTMKRNCEREVLDIIGLARNAEDAYNDLKARYERRTIPDLLAALTSVIRLSYDDQNTSVEEHIAEYERKWNIMLSTVAGGHFPTESKGFGEAIAALSKCDQAKTEFLLKTFPPFYSILVAGIRNTEGYTYGDVCRRIQLHVPGRQQEGRRGATDEGVKENPVVLRAEGQRKGSNGKRCGYCVGKGRAGRSHTEDECYTKDREQGRKVNRS